ncbi:DUF2589 domain-containing protein [Methanothrix harundinacea]|uniref:DUF2589 domain-containing protein n=1 Tax=Methanothrix harundinacea (strain 6Ac) TaxID=1110509 RepID=G7WQE7_METH6|nr:DUF2589 domain-containing protein [Methanothrix harundinacea]AET65500.1 hypothetical protein Mhar_2147 [Methanothrix harundinacea 6Ac]
MVNPGQELSSIDFESMIGGPLIAVVNAQAQAALSTVNFIKSVGFKAGESDDPEASDTGDPIYVTFKYPKEISPYQPAVPASGDTPATPAVPAQIQQMKLEVPILTMLPIPFIRIEETTIDFNAKITSMEYRKVDTNLKVDASLEAKAGWFFGSAKLKVSTSYQRSTSEGSNVNRTYSLAIHVKAVQDEMPGGMEKILSILEESMRGQPVSAQAPVVS